MTAQPTDSRGNLALRRLVHLEDEELIAGLVREWVKALPSITYVASYGTIEEGMAYCRKHRPDIVLLDVKLRDGDGLDCADELAGFDPPPHIVLFTTVSDEALIYRAGRARLNIVWKSGYARDELLVAIQAVVDGKISLPGEFIDRHWEMKRRSTSFDKFLSDREISLLRFFGMGHSDEEIAAALGLRISTVQTHRKSIFRKLGLHSTPELMRWARQKGFARSDAGVGSPPALPKKV